MPIQFTCPCGKSLNAPDGSGGKRARCPACGAINTIPTPAPALAESDELELKPLDEPAPRHPPARTFNAPAPPPSPATRIDPTLAYVPERGAQQSPIHQAMYGTPPEQPLWRRYLYFVLLLSLIPLVIYTFVHEKEDDLLERIRSTLEAHQDVPAIKAIYRQIEAELGVEDIDEMIATQPDTPPAATRQAVAEEPPPPELEELENSDDPMAVIFRVLPDHKLDGAMLEHQSKMHWAIAGVSAAFFFTVMLLLFPSPGTKAHSLIFAGLLTGTVGILLLLGFQWCAANTMGANIRVWHGKAAIIFFIIKFIGWSYYLANHPEFGFFLSFLGFTAGVGLCEEFVKIIPVLIRIKSMPGKEDPTWQGLVLWGLASGVGFGVAEGIMYSGEHYNGYSGSGIYFVRFASCVVLHALWTASAAITVYNRQGTLHGAETAAYIGNVILCIGIPVLLHGLYDVLLTQEHPIWALVVAVGSFGYLAFQIERMRKKEPEAGGYPA